MTIEMPDNPTNGDVISVLFANCHIDKFIHDVNIRKNLNVVAQFDKEWWNEPWVINALEQEPCEDAVSRKAVLDKMKERDEELSSICPKDIRALPTVTPYPKTGYWIKISPAGIYECSECGQNVMTSDICAYKFCHGCSAKMIEPQESEG